MSYFDVGSTSINDGWPNAWSPMASRNRRRRSEWDGGTELATVAAPPLTLAAAPAAEVVTGDAKPAVVVAAPAGMSTKTKVGLAAAGLAAWFFLK